MIDVHSHVLPGMDDGSRSVEESLTMLEASAKQGVTCMAATPHFYADENSPEEFLTRRALAAQQLRNAWRPGLPTLKLGAEVCYFEGISRCEGLERLRFEGIDLLLLEMPFCPWTKRMVREVLEIHSQAGITVLLAHIERYLRWQQEEVWDTLGAAGVLNQCNASFFLRWQTKRKALRMLRKGRIHLLGSDCHNMDIRPPRLGEVLTVLGQRERAILAESSRIYLPNWEE